MKIISFEGIEGVGKSTQIKLLTNHFQSTGISYEQFREPGSSDAGEKIRELLLDKSLQLSSSAELLLMFAARSELINQKINNSSAEFVILDRYFHASVAYQGYGRGINLDSIYQLIEITECPTPSLTIILDIDVETGFKRKAADAKDRIESSGDAFFQKVRAGYLEIAKDNDYVKVIDADNEPEIIHEQIISLVSEILLVNILGLTICIKFLTNY